MKTTLIVQCTVPVQAAILAVVKTEVPNSISSRNNNNYCAFGLNVTVIILDNQKVTLLKLYIWHLSKIRHV